MVQLLNIAWPAPLSAQRCLQASGCRCSAFTSYLMVARGLHRVADQRGSRSALFWHQYLCAELAMVGTHRLMTPLSHSRACHFVGAGTNRWPSRKPSCVWIRAGLHRHTWARTTSCSCSRCLTPLSWTSGKGGLAQEVADLHLKPAPGSVHLPKVLLHKGQLRQAFRPLAQNAHALRVHPEVVAAHLVARYCKKCDIMSCSGSSTGSIGHQQACPRPARPSCQCADCSSLAQPHSIFRVCW